ncbi:MAG: pilus assembly protein PilM [Deltaproteobacteria bacterium]|nr:MAG: pilus assembly protein PilM [Deltaproteobacteria bacterium]
MPEKILGIDIGSSSIKVVQVSRGFRVSQMTGYASARLPTDADPQQVAAALVGLISEHNLESERYLVALSTNETFLRRLSFPFSAERKIAQVIGFEMEPGLPLPLDAVQVDFVKTEPRPEGTHGVVAAAFPKGVLDPLLSALQEVGIQPEVVDLDGSGLFFISDLLKQNLPDKFAILDVGHRKTNLLYQNRGKDTYLRSLTIGCGQMSRNVAEVLGISVEEAVERLFSTPLDEEASSAEQVSVRTAVTNQVELLAREIELSLMAAELQDRDLWPELFLLSGGGSLIKSLPEALEKAFGIQVRCLVDMDNLGLLDQFGDHIADVPVFSVAAGLAFKGISRRRGFNFQAEEIRGQSPLVKWRHQVSYGLVACALVAFAWLGSTGIDIYAKNKRLARINQSIEEVFRRTLPEFKGSVRPEQYASVVKNKIAELNQSVALFGAEAKQHSSAELLRVISQAIPKDLDVTISLLTVDNERVRLSGRADGFNTVDGVKNRLVALENFDQVTITGAKAATDGQGVQFGLELLRQQLTGEGS